MTPTTKRRWYQFSLRTLWILLTLLCVGPGSFVAYEQQKARKPRAAVQALEKLGCRIVYDETAPVRSTAMRLLLGDDSFGNVESVDLGGSYTATDADLRHLPSLPRLKYLHFHLTEITDDGLVQLFGLKNLKQLDLDGLYFPPSCVTPAGVDELKKALPNCRITIMWSTSEQWLRMITWTRC